MFGYAVETGVTNGEFQKALGALSFEYDTANTVAQKARGALTAFP